MVNVTWYGIARHVRGEGKIILILLVTGNREHLEADFHLKDVGYNRFPVVKNFEKNICVSKIYLLLNKQIKNWGAQVHFRKIKYYATLPFHQFYNRSK